MAPLSTFAPVRVDQPNSSMGVGGGGGGGGRGRGGGAGGGAVAQAATRMANAAAETKGTTGLIAIWNSLALAAEQNLPINSSRSGRDLTRADNRPAGIAA